MGKHWKWMAIPILVLAIIASAWAGDVTAKIRGTVADQNGAVLPNVTVTATNEQTGVAYNTTTQSTGAYQFLQLPVGRYSISATAPNFQKFTARGITLVIDQQYVEDIKLHIGEASQTVEVQANAVQVDTSNIQLSNVVDSQQVVDLPLIGRNFTQLETIFPGVQGSSDRFGTFSSNGAQSQQSSFLVNGTDINDAPINTAVVIPSPDSVQQFNLVTSSLNPEYSRNSGAIVSVNIKNGTNAYHGDVFEFYRDTFLNTRNWFQSKAPTFHQNTFGGTLGGPIIKNKLFFFLSYQGRRARQPQAVGVNTVYTAAQRSGNWAGARFSGNPIPSSITIPGCSTGEKWSDCATALNGVFPTSAFNPIASNLVSKYVPLPNVGTNNFTFNPASVAVNDQGIMRFDFSPSQANQFWFSGIIQHAPQTDDLPFTASTLPGFAETAQSEIHQFSAAWTHMFTPSTLNELRAGYTRFNFASVVPVQTIDPASLGFNIKPQAPQYAQVPFLGVTGYFILGFSTNGPQPRIDQNYQLSDNFSKVAGNHTLKFGFDGRLFKVNNPFYGSLNGSYAFGGNGKYSTGDPGLDFLLGIPDSYGQGSGGIIDAYAKEGYLYAQDQWKIRSDLTLTYGLGWQVDTPWHNLQYNGKAVTCFLPGQQSKVFPTAPVGLNYPGDPGCNDASGATTSWKHFGPRVGFAYAPSLGWLSAGDSHKLSIRGGYGIYFNRTEEEGSLQNLGDPPFGLATGGIGDVGGFPQFANPFADINGGGSIPNKFPASFANPPGTGVDWTQYEPFILSQYSPGYSMPYSQNFNLTIERELPSNIVAAVSYVGALGRHEQVTVEGNPITQAGHDACLADPACISNRTIQSLVYPNHTKFGNGDIFPSEGLISSSGTSNYNSMQLSARKGTTHGLMFQASYTWSHSIDNGSSFENSGFGGLSRGYNNFIQILNRGDSQFDARHRFVFSPIYQVPNWKNLPALGWLPDVIGKGWGVSGILTLQSGFPFDIRQTGSNSLFCQSSLQYYVCPEVPEQTAALKRVDPRNPGLGIPGKVFWFDPKVGFSAEPIGSFGNVRRNPYHGPGYNNTDVAITKNFNFWPGREGTFIQLRLETFNVFNHTNFGWNANNSYVGVNGVFNSSTFGQITSAGPGRQTQLAVKIYF